ncbi:hypothetical protein PG997_001618 [Apiospora hydei]|uniref:RING-type domain-containing protein n=1 Tax=Apiospora hydei TaxID=1337664 RepID=A0ABR1XEH4_9PEZI
MAANTNNNNLTRPIMEQHPTESCPICIEETDQPGNDFVTLPCNGAHKAHPDCFRQWLDSPNAGHDKCPLCRQDLRRSCGHLLSTDLLVAGTAIPKDILESPCADGCPGPEDPEEEDDGIEPSPAYLEWLYQINHFWMHFRGPVADAADALDNFADGWVNDLVQYHEILGLAERVVSRLQAHRATLSRWHQDDINALGIRLWNLERETNRISTTADLYAAERERYTQERFGDMQPEMHRAISTVWREHVRIIDFNLRRIQQIGNERDALWARFVQSENRLVHINWRMGQYVNCLRSWIDIFNAYIYNGPVDEGWWRQQIGEEEVDNASTTAQNGDAEDEDEPQVNDRDEHAAAVHDNSPEDAHLNNADIDAHAPPQQINHNWNGPGFWEAQPANDNDNDNAEPAEDWSNAIGVAGAEHEEGNPKDDDVEGEDDQAAVQQPLQEPEQHDQPDEEENGADNIGERVHRMDIDTLREDLPDTIPQPPIVPAAPEPHYRPLRSAMELAAIAAGALALQQAITAGTAPPAQPDVPLDAAPAALLEIEAMELEVEPEAAEDKDQQDQPQAQRPENDERAAQWTTEYLRAEWERLQRRRWGPKL